MVNVAVESKTCRGVGDTCVNGLNLGIGEELCKPLGRAVYVVVEDRTTLALNLAVFKTFNNVLSYNCFVVYFFVVK